MRMRARPACARSMPFAPMRAWCSLSKPSSAGAVGSASARVLVASSVAQEDVLTPDDVLRILDEASQIRAYSRELEEKSESLQQATADLRKANEQLKSLDKLKDDFMSSVTHELRTPLTSIRALAELLRDDPKMDLTQRCKFFDIIVSETERLSRLVNQVLDMAKIESGHAEWHVEPVDMWHSSGKRSSQPPPMFHERQIAVEVKLPEPCPPVMADNDHLMQVMLNLLSNAAKFVPVVGGRVGVSLSCDDTSVVVAIQDNGPGVTVEQQSLVFERFRQGGDASNRPQGTGLGLPISRQIVEHFGGRLWLESSPPDGARFLFSLPLMEHAGIAEA